MNRQIIVLRGYHLRIRHVCFLKPFVYIIILVDGF